ncbi:hypothetical protein PRIPAC_80259 [Pristionchus pacificus]|uniref:Zinc finger protein n=1 Tax=Pristionchus pacificus TaxID=54126 RepID=A0A2A6C2G0_PRIPA|nr:hypothetical protein PRIPAC_80259 [Pristionchus pacificus]|eukprot:PDM72330.1 zinc finger protein [Pristionchus pacificus]
MWSTLYAAAAAAAAARDHFVENVLVFTTPSSDNDCSTLPSTSHQISATNVDASEFSSSSSGCSQSDDSDSIPSNVEQFWCDLCKKDFRRLDLLTRHMRFHTGEKPFQCDRCHRHFSRSDHLLTHRRTHSDEKPYMCSLCRYAARRKDVLTRHMWSSLYAAAAAAPPVAPVAASPTFVVLMPGSWTLPSSSRVDIQSQLYAPTASITSNNVVVIDNTAQHAQQIPMQTQILPSTVFCTTDDQTFDVTSPVPSTSRVQQKTQCSVDPSEATNNGIAPPYTFADRIEEQCANRALIRCNICERNFPRQDILTRHMPRHSGEKPYHCDQCPRQFSRADHLQTHRRTHFADKPFTCLLCNFAARRRDELNRHTANVHQKIRRKDKSIRKAEIQPTVTLIASQWCPEQECLTATSETDEGTVDSEEL